MKLIDFWPPDDQEHIGDCFFTDADSAKEAVFLAVHQPMQLVRENFRSKNVEPVLQNEDQVLQFLLKKNPANGTLILPIVGDSGVGKSHLIRWLHAHLKLRKDRDSRHIVRIPKSASLRTVLNRKFPRCISRKIVRMLLGTCRPT
jgi:type II secretory pathway predicted ATPase ExeA